MPGLDPGLSRREIASSGMRSSVIRFHFTERQISPPMTQPAVVSVPPESVIVPE